jgi:ribosome-interacting GTPase 1
MTTVDKIKEIEAEMARTQKNKVHFINLTGISKSDRSFFLAE